MEQITALVSIRNNGKLRPENWLPTNWRELDPEELFGPWGSEIGMCWKYGGQMYQINFSTSGYGVLDPLPDRTGFIAIKHQHCPEAHILNGDATVRFVLKPAVNMRGLTEERIAIIRKSHDEKARVTEVNPPPWKPTGLFHYKTERTDVLEIFGDDGFGDCFYRYNTNTGELISAETRPWRS